MPKRNQVAANARRNPLHDHPLMRRGGRHGKSGKAQRQNDRQQLKREWRYSQADRGPFVNNPG